MLSATIVVEQDAEEISKLLAFEEKEIQNGRASFSLKRSKGALKIMVRAEDSTSLRSMLNTITKTITINEKAKQAII